jgi:formamidopyrimidine-DNA glycosylase
VPELPDVEVFKQYLNATALHKKIVQTEARSRKVLEEVSIKRLESDLRSRRFVSTHRHGKFLFVRMDDEQWLVLHFGMTGFLKYFKDMDKDSPHDCLLVTFDNGYHLAYDCQRMFGEVHLIDDVDAFIESRDLGIDALDPDFDLQAFKESVSAKRGSIKSALMNQSAVAGIGNVYSDEILFQAGIHPKTTPSRLNEASLKSLFGHMKDVLQTAIHCRADPERFPKSFITPHRGKEGACPRCEGALESETISGRTSYYCPKCQG